MSEEHKQGKSEPGDLMGERLGREPLLKVEKRGGRTFISGEIDLDQLATEADEALARGFASLRDFAEYDAQDALLSVISQILDQMQHLGMKEADVAKKMGVSRSYVSRLVNATPNLTVISLAKLARAVGGKIRVSLVIDDDKGSGGGAGAPPAAAAPKS